MKLENFLCFGGIEIANAMRTLTYMRRGLAGPEWTVATSDVAAEGGGYSDTYVDVYDDDSYSPRNLNCYCAAISDSNYFNPTTDDAPWYQAANPESAEFLGVLIDEATLDAVLTRTVAARAPVGAVLTRMRPRQRVLAVKGQLLATTRRGMAWGERWLTDVLSGAGCSESDLLEALILPACPDSDDADPDRYFRYLVGAGVVDGPNFGPLQDQIPQCKLQAVDFQIAAESPYLWHPATILIQADVGAAVSATASTDSWGGDAVVSVSLTATTDFTGTVTAAPLAAGQTCPNTGANPCVSYGINALPAGNQLIIDPLSRAVSEVDGPSKQIVGGFDRLVIDGLFNWIEVPPCSSLCVTVSATSGSAFVVVAQIGREL